MTSFTCSTTTVDLSSDPLLPLSLIKLSAQTDGLDSAGARHVAQLSVATRPVSLAFPLVTAAALAAFNTFVASTLQGSRTPFTWTDHDAAEHDVRYTGHTWTRLRTGGYRVTLDLVETL